MRHRQRGRTLGRSPSHRKAMLRNLACSLILTERDEMYYDGLVQGDGKTKVSAPAKKGRVVTTLHKAKEVRPLVEKCVTIAKKAIPHEEQAAQYATDADRNSDAWRTWRQSDEWRKWSDAMAPALAARRYALRLLRDKEAVSILFNDIAPRFLERPGGFTRILRLATPRLGDAGTRAIIEFVGQNDRVKQTDAQRPAFDDDGDAADHKTMEDEVINETADTDAQGNEIDTSSESAVDESGDDAEATDDETKD